jgi:2-polyprenyl-3-methyl-5-hydroxy-6-metoxy-1,4-benzoquinol methylase
MNPTSTVGLVSRIGGASDCAASEHYLGNRGATYFSWQRKQGEPGARLYARKFERRIMPSDTVLDFGCGGGYLLKALHCAARIGVEVNPAARTCALENGVTCYADLSEVPSRSIDVAISHHALEHVPFPIGTLSDIRSKLKTSGRLILCLPVERWSRKYHVDDVNHHLYGWTPQLLGNTLHEAGFTITSDDIHRITYRFTRYHLKAMRYCPPAIIDLSCVAYALVCRHHELIADVTPDWNREPNLHV